MDEEMVNKLLDQAIEEVGECQILLIRLEEKVSNLEKVSTNLRKINDDLRQFVNDWNN